MNSSLVSCFSGACSLCDLLKVAENIFFWLLSIAFVVAVLLAMVSGILTLTAYYSEERLKIAKNALQYCLIGFGVCLVSWLIIHFVYTTAGFKGTWWRMECEGEAEDAKSVTKIAERDIYLNEVTANNLGGRDNPLALPELTPQVMKNLPENKYFFLHGLGGQPLLNAAKQLTVIVREIHKQGKFVYVLTPKKDPKSYDIVGSQAIKLNDQIGSNLRETQANIKKLIVGIIAESPAGTNFPFIITQKNINPVEFNNVWPDNISAEKSLKTYHNGVVYAEGETIKKGEEETLFSINLESVNPGDKNNEKFRLKRDNPITFQIPQDISPKAARQMAVDIAQVVAEATKNAESLDKDQWNQILGLMSKDYVSKQTNKNLNIVNPQNPEAEPGEEEDQVYNPAAFANYALKNPGQVADPKKIAEVEKELDKIAQDIIDKELPRNTNNNANLNDNENQPEEKSILGEASEILATVEDYFIYQFSNTGVLDNWMAEEKKTPKDNQFENSASIDVNRVPNLDPTKLSKIGGRITTDNMLDLTQRESIKNLIIDVQKEMEEASGRIFNIPPDLMMCIFQKETKFDPGAMSQTGCSGLGQMSMGATRSATKKLKKMAPKHFAAFFEKVRQDFGVDMEETLTREGGNDKRRELLRSDPNLNAVLSFVHLTDKGIVGRGGSARNSQDLRSMVIGYGPGNAAYAVSIMYCLQTGSWKEIPEKIQAIIDARKNMHKQ